MIQSVKATILGGILFLIPCGLVLLAVAKLFSVFRALALSFRSWLPVDSVVGVALVDIMAVFAMGTLAFVAGKLAMRPAGKRVYQPIDSKVALLFPRYVFLKNTIAQLSEETDEQLLKPVRVNLDDQSQIAFEVERTEGGEVVVYLPGAPDPWSGVVAYVRSERVELLAGDFNSVTRILRQVGKGAGDLLT